MHMFGWPGQHPSDILVGDVMANVTVRRTGVSLSRVAKKTRLDGAPG